MTVGLYLVINVGLLVTVPLIELYALAFQCIPQLPRRRKHGIGQRKVAMKPRIKPEW
jgi:hypothetical protein